MQTLLIDNYDSYTYLIARYLWQINGTRPLIIKNNALSIEALKDLSFDNIVISPGPGTPENEADAGLSLKILESYPDTPILGICLGHQCLGQHFGGKIIHAPKEMHGKYSEVCLKPSLLFKGLPSLISVVRYHSLIVEKPTLPNCLESIAETTDEHRLIMALQHNTKPFYGVQFHPESIGTQYGEQIFKNFKDISKEWLKNGIVALKNKVRKRTLIWEELEWLDSEHVFESCFKNADYSFWLDSSMPGYNANYSFMGIPDFIVQKNTDGVIVKYADASSGIETCILKKDFFDCIQEHLAQIEISLTNNEIPFTGGFVGYLSYEAVTHVGAKLAKYQSEYPECLFMWVENFIAFDHKNQQVFLCSIMENEKKKLKWFSDIKQKILSQPVSPQLRLINDCIYNQTEKLPLTASRTKSGYINDINRIKQYLKNGETYETCLTNEFKVQVELESYELYRVLRLTNAAPYSAYIHLPDFDILSSSPECFININKDGRIKSEPIKGTRAKGVTAKETAKIKKQLIESSKDHSELLMIIDLIRNDLSVFCEKGSVKVKNFMKVTEYATLLQLSSVIEGQLDKKISVIEVLKSIFPGGSITGAPKYRTMQIIDKIEQRPRGIYTGSIGYLSVSKSAEFNIAIRTMIKNGTSNEIVFGSGGAIIAESDPEEEYKEILIKAYALIRAIYLAKFRKFENYQIETIKSSLFKNEPGNKNVQNYYFKSPDLESVFRVDAPAVIS